MSEEKKLNECAACRAGPIDLPAIDRRIAGGDFRPGDLLDLRSHITHLVRLLDEETSFSSRLAERLNRAAQLLAKEQR